MTVASVGSFSGCFVTELDGMRGNWLRCLGSLFVHLFSFLKHEVLLILLVAVERSGSKAADFHPAGVSSYSVGSFRFSLCNLVSFSLSVIGLRSGRWTEAAIKGTALRCDDSVSRNWTNLGLPVSHCFFLVFFNFQLNSSQFSLNELRNLKRTSWDLGNCDQHVS